MAVSTPIIHLLYLVIKFLLPDYSKMLEKFLHMCLAYYGYMHMSNICGVSDQ